MSMASGLGWVDEDDDLTLQGPPGIPGPAGAAANATNPILDEIVVFGSSTVSPPDIKSADGPVTLGQGLTITHPSDPNADVMGLVVQASQSAVSGKAVKLYVTNTASGTSSSAIALGRVGSTGWEWYVDPDHTDEDRIVLKRMNWPSNALDVSASDMLVKTPTGLKTTRIDMETTTANPGSSTTLWSDTTSSDCLMYGSEEVAMTTDIPLVTNPTSNNLVVFDSSGGFKRADAVASLGQPLECVGIRFPITQNPDNMFRVGPAPSTGNSAILTMQAPVTGYTTINWNGYFSSGAGEVQFNPANARWRIGVDQRSSQDFFFIEHRNSATTTNEVLRVDAGTNPRIKFPTGSSSPSHTLTSSAANPGGASTLWYNSSDATHPQFGSGTIALLSDISGYIPSYSHITTLSPSFGTDTGLNSLRIRRMGDVVTLLLNLEHEATDDTTLDILTFTSPATIPDWMEFTHTGVGSGTPAQSDRVKFTIPVYNDYVNNSVTPTPTYMRLKPGGSSGSRYVTVTISNHDGSYYVDGNRIVASSVGVSYIT